MLEIKDMETDYTRPADWVKQLLLFVVILCVVFGLYYFRADIFPKKVPKINTENLIQKKGGSLVIDDLSANEQLDYLSVRKSVDIPEADIKATMLAKNLPIPILSLFSQVSNIEAESVVYEGGKKGYKVVYSVEKSSTEVFKTFSQSFDRNVWKILTASYTEKAGVIVLESKSFKISMDFVEDAGNKTKVKMMVVNK